MLLQNLVSEDCNVISVDWRKLAGTSPFYNIAAANSKPVGYLTADLVNFLVSEPNARLGVKGGHQWSVL